MSTVKSLQRKIIHGDCDCFFAAIEMRDNPLLRDIPMAVGGHAEQRGVISTCNYEARAYGVRSAMATVMAKKLCPELLVVPHSMEKYRQAAQQIREIFYDYSDCVEPVSLDEAYLDVSESSACQGSATLIAQQIRKQVLDTVGITLSAGVAPNKFLAKVGSDWNKPNGLCVITPPEVDSFVQHLPVVRLHGVGKVMAAKLHQHGIYLCGDLRRYSVFELVDLFGSFGSRLYELSWGRDDRAVVSCRVRKSLSVEHTYANDLLSIEHSLRELPVLFGQLNQRLAGLSHRAIINKQFVKFKFSNFQTTTMECRVHGYPRLSVFRQLLNSAFLRGAGQAVRLMGLGVRFQLDDFQNLQLSLFDDG